MGNMLKEIGLSKEAAFRKWKEENGHIDNKALDSDYDHRWDSHPSWYTDDKNKQRQMVRKSIQKRRENWD